MELLCQGNTLLDHSGNKLDIFFKRDFDHLSIPSVLSQKLGVSASVHHSWQTSLNLLSLHLNPLSLLIVFGACSPASDWLSFCCLLLASSKHQMHLGQCFKDTSQKGLAGLLPRKAHKGQNLCSRSISYILQKKKKKRKLRVAYKMYHKLQVTDLLPVSDILTVKGSLTFFRSLYPV